jgi:GAF domain-containing protein
MSASERHAIHYLRDTVQDRTWPNFSKRASVLGLRSVLAFTLWPQDELLGALNFYSRSSDAFTAEHQDIGAILAAQAGALVVLDTARRAADLENRLSEAEAVQEHLKSAIQSRDVISTAKGILAEREGVSPEQAFDLLRRASQHLNQKLRDVALEVVEEERRRRTE